MSTRLSVVPSDDVRTTHRRAWTKVLTRRRLSEFERAILDPELTSLRQELVKVDLRIAELEERARKGETKDSWARTCAAVDRLREATDGAEPVPDLEKIRALVGELTTLCSGGLNDRELWSEIGPLMERRRRLTATELKREELMKVSIPMAKVVLFFDQLHGVIESVLTDRETQLRLLHALRLRFNEENDVRSAVPLRLPAAYDLGAAEVSETELESDLDSEPVE